MEIFTKLVFESAHHLPNVPEGHKCGRIHGHQFIVMVYVSGPVGETTGWVIDFADIEAACRTVLEELDHRYLNNIEGLENPTSENLARWIWKRVKPKVPLLSKLVVQESDTCGCIYQGENR